MPRFKLILEFDGGPFVGWQRQDNGVSIQGALEDAVFRFCGERITAHAAGRTDSGVHAIAMPAHIDLEKPVSADVVRDALNFYLRPAPIAILEASEAGGDFHARFSAKSRSYRYRIVNRRAPLTIDAGRAWRVSAHLDAAAMDEAAQALVGKHDFTTFRAAKCQASTPVKTLGDISVTRTRDDILVETSAPSFLHHQVRSIVGSLVDVGTGRWPVSGVRDALAARDRSACGQVAPPDGLYFVKAEYD